jgi:formylglycine-generating enzyme required for sulfatase activity
VVQKFNVLRVESLAASGHVVFGHPEESAIWRRVAMVGDMPPAQVRPLSAEEKDAVKGWIEGPPKPPSPPDIIATVQGDPRLNPLFQAAQASGAVELLKNPGPFTLFAPTDRAFSELGENNRQALLQKNKSDATLRLLLNHGMLGRYLARDLEKLGQVNSAAGYVLSIRRNRGDQKLWIGPANAVVVEEDIVCSNGVIHVIDRVIVPPNLPWPGRPWYVTKNGLKMIEIPGGTFTMGSPPPADPGTESEVPQRSVQLSTFYLSEHEVTWQQYQDLEPNNPAPEWIRQIPPGQKPVGSVSWIQAAAFCNKLSRLEGMEPYYAIGEGDGESKAVTVPAPDGSGYRLPTEAEWEYAARAGSTSAWFFGDDLAVLGDYAWYSANSGGGPNAVKLKKPNAWDLYDMYGNVAEWCEDWFGPYQEHPGGKPLVSPRGPATPPSDTKLKVYRGGSYIRPPACCRSAWRGSAIIDFQHQAIGIRVARTPPRAAGPLLVPPNRRRE